MRTNNYFWMLAAGTVLFLIACHSTEILDQRQEGRISLRTTVSNATKAVSLTPDYLKEEGFHLTAFENPLTESNPTKLFEIDLGKDQYKADGYYVEDYFWGDQTLYFYAWYPKSEAGALSVDADHGYAITYIPAADAAQQKDFSIAYNTGDKEHNASSGVNLNFRHALSQVEIKVNNGSTVGNTVIVKGVKVGNAIKSGTISMPLSPTDEAIADDGSNLLTGLWSGNVRTGADKNIRSYSIIHTNPITITPGNTQSVMGSGGNWMVVPQVATDECVWDVTKGGAGESIYMALLVQLRQGSATVFPHSNTPDADKEGEYAWTAVPIPAGATLESGKKYTFTLTFIINTGNAGNLISNGEEVLSHPIKLVVSVDDWVQVPDEGEELQ